MIRWFVAAAVIATPLPAMAQPGAAGFATRLQRVEDQLAIERILVDYAAFLDGRDYARYADLFTPDGEWVSDGGGGYKGRAAIRGMLESMLGPTGAPNRSNYHIITNPRVDLAGDRATATSRFLFVMRGPDGRPTPALAGIYHDELVRQSGVWKIKRRVADNIMPTSAEWRKIMPSAKTDK